MKNIKYLFLCLLVFIIFSVIYYSAFKKQINKKSDDASGVVSKVGKEGNYGYIEGKLGYPGERIPSMTVCAEEVNSKKVICSNESNFINETQTCNLPDWENHIGEIVKQDFDVPDCKVGLKMQIGYELKVPVGDYVVYSFLNNYRRPPSDRAYYTNFVVCGFLTSCPHEIIVVKVEGNQTVYNIDPADWYR
jgi:hypothetical protein